MQIIWLLVEVVLAVMVGQFILGPPVLYLVTRHAAKPQFQSFDLLNPPMRLPPSYARNIARLEELGFQTVAHVSGAGNSRVRYVLTLFTNQAEQDRAIVAHMLAETPVTRVVLNYVEFYTDFEDGSEVNTVNSKQPAGFVQVPEKKIYRVPHLTEPKQLYALHRALLAQGPALRKQLPPAGEEVSSLIAGMERDFAREASFGRFRLDRSGFWYRLTVKGAILNALKFGWPVGQVRRHLVRSEGKRLARSVLHGQ